jgi:hypothetical protein
MPSSRIKIILTFDSGKSIQVETCPIENSLVLPMFMLSLSWNIACLDVYINAKHVASTDKTKNIELRIVCSMAATEKPGFFMDISAQNEECRRARIPKDGVVCDPARVCEQLSGELSQMKDLLELIGSGKTNHLHGLARQIRALICRGGKNMDPLLQRAGGVLGLPLLIYDIPRSVEDFSQVEGLSFRVSQSFSVDKKYLTQVPTDLDVWLEKEDSFLGTDKKLLKYTNNKTIRAFADREAAHYDRKCDPLITYFKQIQTPNALFLQDYFVAVAQCILGMGDSVLVTRKGVAF